MAGQKFTVKEESTLLEYLYTIYPGRSKTGIKNMLSKGQIVLCGKQTTAFDAKVHKGDRLEVLAKGVSIARSHVYSAREELEKTGVRIAYEDDNYIVADKPSGLLTISTARGSASKSGHKEMTLYAILNAYVKVQARSRRKEDLTEGRTPDRSTAKIWIVHRIDKGTSGLVVFAKNERAKDILQSRWKELILERNYVAVLEGDFPEDSGTIESWLVENPKSLKVYSVPEEIRGAHYAVTRFTVLARTKASARDINGHTAQRPYSLVQFSLDSGRKNQIRVHSADRGCPVAGDTKYGAVTDPFHRLALHAESLVFKNPYSGETLELSSPLPEVFGRIVF